MKKLSMLLLGVVLMFALAACSSKTTPPSNQPPSPSAPAESEEPNLDSQSEPDTTSQGNEDAKILVAYFSMPETTDPNNRTKDEDNSVVVIDGKVLGNTQYVAQLIQENTDANIFRIEPETPYPTDHQRFSFKIVKPFKFI